MPLLPKSFPKLGRRRDRRRKFGTELSFVAVMILIVALLLPADAAWALRIVDYNLLNYPGNTGTLRAPHYRTILGPLGADLIVAQEVNNANGPNQFVTEVLNVLEPGQWATVPFIDGNDTDASIFYKPSKLVFLGQWAFYPYPADPLRYIHVYRLRPVGYASPSTELRIYTAHLKASTGYESQRLAECIGIRDSLNAMPPGTHAILCGDLNFYRQSTEPGYAKLLEFQSNNTGRLFDLLPAGEWHDNQAYAPYHTQSPCLSGSCASGAATGGMDDRFDFILPTYSLGTPHGLAVLPGTCLAVGQDGLHLNRNITDAPTIPEGAAYASALQLASDHLPLRIDLQLPAKIDHDPDLAFSPVIVGAPPSWLDLTFENPTVPPADSLNCTLQAPDGFGAPATLAVPAGGSVAAMIAMNADAVGWKSGNLTVLSDAPDDPVRTIELSGTVLDHARASLDSLSLVTEQTLDFGTHAPGEFPTMTTVVHNLGWDNEQARLAVTGADIAGGGGIFSLPGFEPILVAGTGARWTLFFDDGAAMFDSTYEAVLTFASADEPLPGALDQPALRYTLRARVASGATVPTPSTPLVTRLLPPAPNPLESWTDLRFDLARAAHLRLEVFDAAGRSVASLATPTLAPGTHAVRWDGRAENGQRLAPGVYFLRLTLPGVAPRSERLVIVR